ncbi:hypothetical protein E1292_18205 [Nonomuraea deserti]|uniref:ATPase n=1 Tax=Nonomuraea deserti TaxID=1848322 RepID=A0A4R4VGQ5_9ACTN|nr:hypothetical protein [Nonomuraea deserti]TDD04798.1 hypothetical protein E1292_18205 [Nonomuraea deserti]
MHEEQEPWCELRIEACEPPHRLTVSALDAFGAWRVDLLLAESAGMTELRFVQHLDGTDLVGDVGPGWEYYLDMLATSRDGSPKPDFTDYHPAMQAYYRGLSPEAPAGA